MPAWTQVGRWTSSAPVSASIAGARADFARERSLRRLTLVSVAAEVVLAYTDVRGTQARLAVARDNVANQESASELTQQLLTAGRGTQLDVDRSIALLESTRASIPPLVAAESAAIYRLGVLVGPSRRRWRPTYAFPVLCPRRPTCSRSENRSHCCADGPTWRPAKMRCSLPRLARGRSRRALPPVMDFCRGSGPASRWRRRPDQ